MVKERREEKKQGWTSSSVNEKEKKKERIIEWRVYRRPMSDFAPKECNSWSNYVNELLLFVLAACCSVRARWQCQVLLLWFSTAKWWELLTNQCQEGWREQWSVRIFSRAFVQTRCNHQRTSRSSSEQWWRRSNDQRDMPPRELEMIGMICVRHLAYLRSCSVIRGNYCFILDKDRFIWAMKAGVKWFGWLGDYLGCKEKNSKCRRKHRSEEEPDSTRGVKWVGERR